MNIHLKPIVQQHLLVCPQNVSEITPVEYMKNEYLQIKIARENYFKMFLNILWLNKYHLQKLYNTFMIKVAKSIPFSVFNWNVIEAEKYPFIDLYLGLLSCVMAQEFFHEGQCGVQSSKYSIPSMRQKGNKPLFQVKLESFKNLISPWKFCWKYQLYPNDL